MTINKFRVSGFPRTGTTVLSAILNSQHDSCCLEIQIEHYSSSPEDIKNKNILCIIIETVFTQYGIAHPDFRKYKKFLNVHKK